MESEGSVPYTQKPATGPYADPVQFTPHRGVWFLYHRCYNVYWMCGDNVPGICWLQVQTTRETNRERKFPLNKLPWLEHFSSAPSMNTILSQFQRFSIFKFCRTKISLLLFHHNISSLPLSHFPVRSPLKCCITLLFQICIWKHKGT